jgi:hypothetical protein
MKNRIPVLLSLILLVVTAAFTGTALAGNGNGHGNGNGNGSAPGQQKQTPTQPAPAPAPAPAEPVQATDKTPKQSGHGNPHQSASAVTVKTHGSAHQSASTKGGAQASASTSSHASHGQSKHQSVSPTAPTTADNSQGVKPSNSTQHNTYAPAWSNKTKVYGNGKTAGQIATQAGYGNATLHGPGNSQPHKVLCGGHEVDVHALKNHPTKCGTSSAQSTQQSSEQTSSQQSVQAAAPCTTTLETVTKEIPLGIWHKTGNGFVLIHPSLNSAHYSKHADDQVAGYETVQETIAVPAATCSSTESSKVVSVKIVSLSSTSTSTSSNVSSSTSTSTSSKTAVSNTTGASTKSTKTSSGVAGVHATKTSKSAGGVLGAQKTLSRPKPSAGGVLGATTRLGHSVASGTLPFTGLRLWIVALVALGLIGFGLLGRRLAGTRV